MIQKEINNFIPNITDKFAMVIPDDDPSPIAYINLFDQGDVWIKIKGCDECPIDLRLRCCNKCPCIVPDGKCYWHSSNPHGDSGDMKPFRCIKNPSPKNGVFLFCSLEFECVAGPNKGKVRRLKDKLNVLFDPKTGEMTKIV